MAAFLGAAVEVLRDWRVGFGELVEGSTDFGFDPEVVLDLRVQARTGRVAGIAVDSVTLPLGPADEDGETSDVVEAALASSRGVLAGILTSRFGEVGLDGCLRLDPMASDPVFAPTLSISDVLESADAETRFRTRRAPVPLPDASRALLGLGFDLTRGRRVITGASGAAIGGGATAPAAATAVA